MAGADHRRRSSVRHLAELLPLELWISGEGLNPGGPQHERPRTVAAPNGFTSLRALARPTRQRANRAKRLHLLGLAYADLVRNFRRPNALVSDPLIDFRLNDQANFDGYRRAPLWTVLDYLSFSLLNLISWLANSANSNLQPLGRRVNKMGRARCLMQALVAPKAAPIQLAGRLNNLIQFSRLVCVAGAALAHSI